jgi:hypothetical protein
MSTFRAIPVALGASVALAMLAGCAGGNSPVALSPSASGAGGQSVQRHVASTGINNSLLPPNVARISNTPTATASFMDPDAAGKPLIFVSDAADGVIDIYAQAGKNQKRAGQITGLKEPQGITTDKNRDLYVANTNASNVLVYAPPYTGKPILTITDAGEYPADVAVSRTGVVAVTNICNAPTCLLSTGNVAIYAKGATKSCANVSDNAFNFAQVMFAAYNNGGDLYIDGLNSGYQTSFGLVTGGCNATSITYINYVYTVSFPGGIQIDKAGRIAFADPYRQQVATFDPPVSDTFGQPVTTTPLTGAISPLGFALLASGTDLYVADPGGAGLAEEYPYTAGGSAINTIAAGGQPIGVAVTPPLTKENN